MRPNVIVISTQFVKQERASCSDRNSLVEESSRKRPMKDELDTRSEGKGTERRSGSGGCSLAL